MPEIVHLPDMQALTLSDAEKLTDYQVQKLGFLIANLGHESEAVEKKYASVEFFFDQSVKKFAFTKADGSPIFWEDIHTVKNLPATDPINIEREQNKSHILAQLQNEKTKLLQNLSRQDSEI